MFVNQPELIPVTFVLAMIIILLSVSLFLYNKWQNRMYLILAATFCFALLPPCIMVLSGVLLERINPFSPVYVFLSSISYILVQMGFYHLFKPKDTKKLRVFIGFAGAVLLLSFSLFVLSNSLANLIVLLMTLAFTLYCFFYSAPQLSKKKMYVAALIVYGSGTIIQIVPLFIYQPILVFLSILSFLVFYFMMFMVLFDRIVQLIHAASYTSMTDGLTGLYNRKYFNKQVEESIKRKNPLSVIFCDIDNFKKLNDTYGHQVGDDMLKLVANIVKEETMGVGVAGRYGGEEIVALVNSPNGEASKIAESIRGRVEKDSLALTNISVTLSIGFSKHIPDVNMEELVKQADEAMYISKMTGKNKVTEYKVS